MAVVLTSLATLWIIWRVLGSRAKLPILSILALGFLNFVTLTVERSYVQTSTEVPVIAADNIQGYVGGVYNVAIGTEVPTYFPESRDIRGLFYDFARPTIGLNLIVKDWERNYSNIYFNKRMFTHVDRRSQIIPMVSQSYIYLGFAFSPALTLLFIWLAYRLQYLIHEFRYIELQAVLILCTMRLGYIFGQNSMNMMNFLSLNLVIPFLIAGFYLAVKREHRLGQRRSLSMAMAAQSKKLLP